MTYFIIGKDGRTLPFAVVGVHNHIAEKFVLEKLQKITANQWLVHFEYDLIRSDTF